MLMRIETFKKLPSLDGYGAHHQFLIVSESPASADVQNGKAFQSFSGDILLKTLSQLGLNKTNCFFTYLIPHSLNGIELSEEEFDYYKCRLYDEIERIQPKKILFLGEYPSYLAFGWKKPGKSLQKIRGVYFPFIFRRNADSEPLHRINALYTYCPKYVLGNYEYFTDFRNDCTKFAKTEPYDNSRYSGYTLSSGEEETIALLDTFLKNGSPVVMDIETYGNPYQLKQWGKPSGEILTIGFSQTGEASPIFVVPGDHFKNCSVLKVLHEVNEKCGFICHNGMFEYQWFSELYGIELNLVFDTLLAHYTLDERGGEDSEFKGELHSLKKLGGTYLDLPDWSEDFDNPEDFKNAPRESLFEYLSYDIYATKELERLLKEEIKEEGTDALLSQKLIPYSIQFAKQKIRGLRCNLSFLEELENRYDQEIREMEAELNRLTHQKVNVNSNKQLSKLLFDYYGLKRVSGNSSNNKVCTFLLRTVPEDSEPFQVLKILNLIRSKKHQTNTYVKGLRKHLYLEDGDGDGDGETVARVRTDLRAFGTDTGRPNSKNPNMQNPPRKNKDIKRLFIPSHGYGFAEYDYSAIEFRIAAWYSQDKNMIELILNGRDIHRETAARYYGIPMEAVTDEQRSHAKTAVYGYLYDRSAKAYMTDYNLSSPPGTKLMTLKEAEEWKKAFFNPFETYVAWMVETSERAIKDGYLVTPFGRRRRFPFVTNENRHEIVKKAINFPIQSTANEICLTSSIKLGTSDLCRRGEIIPVHEVHDSILLEVRDLEDLEILRWIKKEMETVEFIHNVPINVDCKIGETWGDLKEIVL